MFRMQFVPRFIPDSMKKLGIVALTTCWLMLLSPAAAAFDVIQITNNDEDDEWPAISGSKVVWAGPNGWDGNGNEIFFWEGVTTSMITNNMLDDYQPAISGSYVVWNGY